ncbi:MAG TPA: sensor domain-containing protein [Gaiellaceae bacterium]|nr:sensor domain-containing protein [Gaiellaceae bacterium]
MRQLTAAVAVAAISTLVAGCGNSDDKGSGSSSPSASATTTAAASKSPVAQAALGNLLLTPAEVDTLLGVTGSKSKEKINKLQDDIPKPQPGWKFPDECVYGLGPVETPVYNGSGFTAVVGDDDVTAMGNDQDIEIAQAVVLFPSAKEASDLFTTSSQRWPACGDRQFTAPASADSPEITWKFGPFANANGILTTTASSSVAGNNGGPPMTVTVGRALTVRNNVVIDILLMRKDLADFPAKVAGQIGDKVDKA